MGSIGIRVLGPLTVDGNGAQLSPRDRVVLAALAVRPGEVLSAEQLADALWGEHPPVSWHKVVPGCVMRLRRVLGADGIETVPAGYRLVIPNDEVDARRFERLVGRARELLTLGEPERAAHLAAEALGLWRGRPFGDLDTWSAGRIEVVRLEELRRDAEELYLDAALRAGRYREVLGEAQTRAAEAPLRERRWALLAIAQYQAGRQGEALRTLHRARTLLATELGVDPGPDLIALEQAILRQDPSLASDGTPPEPMTSCPYLGLVPYDVADADGFFGRDTDVAACLRRLATDGVVVVVGPSGSGKSSLVRAGVAAALGCYGRRVVIITPGVHPMDSLSAVVDDAGPDPVLVVDQCEQAISLCGDGVERSRFFAALAGRAEQAPLVVAMRADRLGDVTAQPEFARLVERGLHLLGPMADVDLRAAIEGPAHQAGLLLEPGLVDLLVREVEGEPGALPLLSHALRQTWERREGRTLTVAGYQATGGIRAAVARTAEELYEQLPPDQRNALRDLLLRLVEPSVDGEPVPVPVPRRKLLQDPAHEQLVELLVDGRLVTSDDGIVQISHECLARAWPRFRGWVEDDVEGQQILRHLSGAADAWAAMGRPDAELYRGIRLRRAQEWRQRSGSALTVTELEFLDDSGHHADAEATRQRHTRRRRRAVIGAVAVLVVAALLAGSLARRQAQRADLATVAADARRTATLANAATDVDRALLLAVEAVRLDDSAETRGSLLTALSRSPALIGAVRGGPGTAEYYAAPATGVSPGGEVVVTSDGTTSAAVRADTLDVVHVFDEPLAKVEYGPDGRHLAVIAQTLTAGVPPFRHRTPVQLLDASTFESSTEQLGGLPQGDIQADDADYSADGRYLAANLCIMRNWLVWDFSCTVVVWDMSAPGQPVLAIDAGRVWGVALGPDDGRLYVATYEPELEVYDVASGELLRSRPLHPQLAVGGTASNGPHEALAVSPDGRTVAVPELNDVVLLDADTLTERGRLVGHSGLVQAVEFSHDGRLLASGGRDSTAIVWDGATVTERERLVGHSGSVRSVAFGPDDATLYSAAEDRQMLVWDLRGDRRFIRRVASFPGPDQPVPNALGLPAPDGAGVAYFTLAQSADAGNRFRFLDLATGGLGETIETGHGNVISAWRPPGFDQFASADFHGVIHLWDWRRGSQRFERQVTSAGIISLSYTPDGGQLVGLDRSASIFRVDADTLEPTGAPISIDAGSGAEARTDTVTIGPDGQTALALLTSGRSAWVDLSDGRFRWQADLGVEPAGAAISPDGSRAVVGAATGAVGLLELETREWIRPPTPSHSGWTLSTRWAPDGTVFATAGEDGRVSLWDGQTGDPLGTILPGPPGVWAFLQVLPDSHTVLVVSRSNEVFTWDTRLETWIDSACAIAGRDLTTDEWREALGERPHRDVCPR